MSYSIDKIKSWVQEAHKNHLDNHEILSKYTYFELREIFNGIGSDAFPEWLRAAISKLHPSLMSVAFIHDVEWYERSLKKIVATVKDKEEFHASNARFKRNGYKQAKINYGWYNPYRYLVEWDALKFSKLCDTHIGFIWWKT